VPGHDPRWLPRAAVRLALFRPRRRDCGEHQGVRIKTEMGPSFFGGGSSVRKAALVGSSAVIVKSRC
jgi:hypothetical protein